MFHIVRALLLCAALIFVVACDNGGHRSRGVGQSAPAASQDVPIDDGGIDNGGGGDGGDDDGGGDGDGDGDDDDSLVWPPSDCNYSMVDETWRPEQDAVWYFNAQFNNNKTMRWNNGAIKVKVLDPRIDEAVLRVIFDELNQLIRPATLHIFNGPVVQADIVIDLNADLVHNTGFAIWQTDDQNRISEARIELGIYEGHECYFYAIVKHYLIQTLGFFNYTQDGGVMAIDFFNDMTTAVVIETLLALYDLRPGSAVGPNGPNDD